MCLPAWGVGKKLVLGRQTMFLSRTVGSRQKSGTNSARLLRFPTGLPIHLWTQTLRCFRGFLVGQLWFWQMTYRSQYWQHEALMRSFGGFECSPTTMWKTCPPLCASVLSSKDRTNETAFCELRFFIRQMVCYPIVFWKLSAMRLNRIVSFVGRSLALSLRSILSSQDRWVTNSAGKASSRRECFHVIGLIVFPLKG